MTHRIGERMEHAIVINPGTVHHMPDAEGMIVELRTRLWKRGQCRVETTVQQEPVDDVSAASPAYVVRRFNQQHVRARAVQMRRTSESGYAGTKDDCVTPRHAMRNKRSQKKIQSG